MSSTTPAEWNIRSPEVLADQRSAYDRMRGQCPVARDADGHWTLFRHADVKRVLLEHETFSNQVSHHISVPNGMDPPEHTPFRQLIEPYFSATRVAWFKPVCRTIADELAQQLQGRGVVDLMAEFALPFALRAQCAFMGWPQSLQGPLGEWALQNQQATLAQDRNALARLAGQFEQIVAGQLDARRQPGVAADADITSELMHEQVQGRALTDAEIASILRNWTVGEVGTLASAIGIIVEFLTGQPQLQQQLREQPDKLYYANDEIQRMHNPLLENRRRTTCPVEIGGRQIAAGERLYLNWVAVNRDPDVFAEPERFSWDRNPQDNLLYGAGVHVCPGAPMARMELVEVMDSLLQHIPQLQLAAGKPPVLAQYPATGFAELWLEV